MNYSIEWSEKAVGDLTRHVIFQKKVSEMAATSVSVAIIEAVESLSLFPERFPEFEMPKNFSETIRKYVIDGRYIVLYGMKEGAVMICRILDARQKFDGLLI